VEQTSGTNPADASAERAPDDGQPPQSPPSEQPGFRSRGRARRRARFLRRARELAYRDLGGLVYNLHRFGQRNDPLVLAKLNTLTLIDNELRTIEAVLEDRRPITVLREAGITACPRCAAIHGSEDRFCPNCGLPMSRHADLPIAGAPAGSPPAADGGAPPAHAGQAPHPGHTPAPAAGAPQPGAPQPQAPAAASAQAPPPVAATPAARPAAPATERHATVPAPAGAGVPGPGRAPQPPARVPADGEQPVGAGHSSAPDEPTEIVRPPASGS
jgi:hypothetical protein